TNELRANERDARARSGSGLGSGLGNLAFPLRLDVGAGNANANLLLQLEDENRVALVDAGDLADHATTRDDFIALAQLAEHRLMLALALHLGADHQEVENPED